jgi:hypothetical protein
MMRNREAAPVGRRAAAGETAHGAVAFGYRAGEDVVVRLRRSDAFDLTHDGTLSASRQPPWTIARILERALTEGRPSYVVRFRHRRAACLCVVPETSIDGTA